MGYGNWIVLADASFPYQDKNGFRTITIPADVPFALDHVLNTIEETQHVKPTFFLTRELRSVPNHKAPGITFHRADISNALHGYLPLELEEALLRDLITESAKTYTVLIIKTRTALPYTSVFIDLDSGYWDNTSEQALRKQVELENDKAAL